MMKTLIGFVCFLILINLNVFACSFQSVSFCRSAENQPDNLVVSGQIIGVDEDGIDFQVMKVFRGTESRAVIRIWDGTDFDCNGLISMAAADLGNINDSLVLILPVIDTLENDWEVMGDYRRPGIIRHTNSLRINNNTIFGLIEGLGEAPPPSKLTQMPYNDFVNSWNATGDCSDIGLHVEDFEEKELNIVYNNPVYSVAHLTFSTANYSSKIVDIFSFTGKKITSIQVNENALRIDFSTYPTGVYLIRVIEEGNRAAVFELVKL